MYKRVCFMYKFVCLYKSHTNLIMSATKYNFSNKVALITGSSSGIGKEIALQLAKYGARVTITGRNSEQLDLVAREIEQISSTGVAPLKIVGDLQNDDSLAQRLVQETVGKFGQLDVLVNNAGGATPVGMLSSENLLEEFDNVFKLNVRSVVELTQLAVPHLEKVQGNIVNISSVAAVKPYQLVYCASKAALDMITKTSALELGPKGIRVNSVNPGPVHTGFMRSRGLAPEVYSKFYENMTAQSLMKRIGTAEDIANLVSFVASDDARNITGSILFSDSGSLVYSPPIAIPTIKDNK